MNPGLENECNSIVFFCNNIIFCSDILSLTHSQSLILSDMISTKNLNEYLVVSSFNDFESKENAYCTENARECKSGLFHWGELMSLQWFQWPSN